MPQQSDLISKFVKLSIRRGSSLASLSKSPDHLRIVVDTFRATARDPLDPDEEDAKKLKIGESIITEEYLQEQEKNKAKAMEDRTNRPISALRVNFCS